MSDLIYNTLFRINYTNKTVEEFDASMPISSKALDAQILTFNGVISPVFTAKTNDEITSIEIEYILDDGFLNSDTLYFNNDGNTNDICSVERIGDKKHVNVKSVTMLKNEKMNVCLGFGQVTAHRFYSWIYIDNNKVGIHYELEDKPLVIGEKYELEKFILDFCESDVFFKKYADTIARINNARPLKEIPIGFCSWSRYYGKVSQNNIENAAEGLYKYVPEKADLVQIDDGWQSGNSFAGEWTPNTEKFPDLKALSDSVHEKGMKFGLWVAPLLLSKKSPYYNDLKDLALDEETLGATCPFNLGDPRFLEHLKNTFKRLTQEYNVDYYKLDFLSASIRHFVPGASSESVRFDGDYSVALLRRALQAIREAVGDNVILLACGAPILECVGIFDAQRTSCDIIWGKNPNFPPMWDILLGASNSILHKYFYNNTVFRNDPDGLVVRDYDVGDGFTCTLDEARFWATTIAMSGGLVLHNEELDAIDPRRRELFLKLTDPIGVAGRPIDYFEIGHTTRAVIDYSKNKKYVALYNPDNTEKDLTLNLCDIEMQGASVTDYWTDEHLGILNEITVKNASPHSAYMFVLTK